MEAVLGPDDVALLRAQTPGCAHCVHLDNAGAALMPTSVILAQRQQLEREVRLGGYRAADVARPEAEQLYPLAAQLLGCEPDEVAYVDSATRAWDLALLSLELVAGDQILTSRLEYASNMLSFLHLAERTGVEVVVAPTGVDGVVDVEALSDRITARTKLVALTHVPTQGGAVQPAAAVGRLARAAGVPFLLDACQSVGHVDVRDVRWDLLSTTGRKYLRGPRGTGLLGIRRAMLEGLRPPTIDLFGATWTGPDTWTVRDDARRYELWERSWAGQLGLTAAIRVALDSGIEALQARIATLGEALRERLSAIDGVTVHDRGSVRCGIVTFSGPFEPAAFKAWARQRDVHVSVTSRSSAVLDLADRGIDALVRASVHAYNDDDELDTLVELVEAAVRGGGPTGSR